MFEEVGRYSVLDVVDFCLHDAQMGVDAIQPRRDDGVIAAIFAAEELNEYGWQYGGGYDSDRTDEGD